MANVVKSDLVERDQFYFELDCLSHDARVEVIRSADGWSARNRRGREIAYRRQSEEWTRDHVECIELILSEAEELLYGQLKKIVGGLESVELGAPAQSFSAGVAMIDKV